MVPAISQERDQDTKGELESEPNLAGAPLAPVSPAGHAEATPSMAQFLEIKAANPDSLLWYRMGDFYELFFQDAISASAALGIVLTKRGKYQGKDIPMCGVPVHRADEYLQRLIKHGFRIAVCEQLEDPAEARKRGSKSVVKRDVVRLVTPGTITEETLLDAKARNYLTAIFLSSAPTEKPTGAHSMLALASVDISTGEFELGEVSGPDLAGELVRLAPSEVIGADTLLSDAEVERWIVISGAKPTPVPRAYFDSLSGERDLKAQLGVRELQGFGSFSRPELAAAGAILKYIALTQVGNKGSLRPPRKCGAGTILTIDAATRGSLELIRSTSGDKSGGLLAAIDRTITGAGARELQAQLASPLAQRPAIQQRLDAVGFFTDQMTVASDVRQILRAAPDVARAMSRLAFSRGGPRDLAAVRDGLCAAKAAATLLDRASGPLGLPTELGSIATRLAGVDAGILTTLTAALSDDPPHSRRDGGFVRAGFSAELDKALALRDDSRGVMAGLETRYAEQTGVKSLKIRHNNILGFFVEVTQLNAKPLLAPPHAELFRHRQSMANAMRFTTPELIDIEGQIASATDRALSLEQDIFDDLARRIADASRAISDAALSLAELDVFSALAVLAVEQNYVRPVIDDSQAFDIRGGRHPVVEQALAKAKSGAFIENDCRLGRAGQQISGQDELPDARIWLVTGPNMAGKSTFLRQNALIVVLAQMGSYVPARAAHIGIVDRLFSRVGASDDLARGRSTFMVEMVETSAILHQATDRSLVILDEIGRGTATFDGLSIAWATVEYLHQVTRARALFATHYHELTSLARRLDGITNVTMDVAEWQDDIVFLHKVKRGAADRSYGIQVAKLAGLPEKLITRAREVLTVLEKGDRRLKKGGDASDLPLFSADRTPPAVAPPATTSLEAAVAALRPDELSPKAALDKLYELKALQQASPKRNGKN